MFDQPLFVGPSIAEVLLRRQPAVQRALLEQFLGRRIHPVLEKGFHFLARGGVAVVDGGQDLGGACELDESTQFLVAAVLAVWDTWWWETK